MVKQILSPSVKDGQEAKASTEVARRARDLEQCLTDGAEKQPIDDARILQGEGRESIRQRKHDVGIRYGQ